jgi:PAS domain S-box-containing protein
MELAFEFPGGDGPQVAATQIGEQRLLEMVASGCALPEVVDALCSFVDGACADFRCGVYLVDWGGPRLRTLAAPRLPDAFNEAVCRAPLHSAAGPCARAACLKTQVIAIDVESDPLWRGSSFRSLAAAHGLRSCWSTPICSRAGRVMGTLAVFQGQPAAPTVPQQEFLSKITHITAIAIERAQSEAALRQSESFLVEAQRLSSTGCFSWCLATDDLTWSEEMYRICGFDRHRPMTLERFLTRVHPDDLALVTGMIERSRREGSGYEYEYEYRVLLPDSSVKYLHVRAHGARDQNGDIEFIGAIQDVTDRHLSQLALDKARSELAHMARVTSLGALTASIAHELNQPLAGIITNAGTCVRMLGSNPPNIVGALETTRRTIRDGNRAAEVISGLRALFTRKGVATEALDLNEAAREVLALTLNELQRNQVVLRMELQEDLPAVMGNRVQLQQVILNLVMNAADAMSGVDDRSRILLLKTAAKQSQQVSLSVADTGVGFGSEVVDRLFESFYTTKPEGLGIGLFVSRFIIESHQGSLHAEPNDGAGATFSFSIPQRAYL